MALPTWVEHGKWINTDSQIIIESALLIWWSIVVMIDPLTIGMGSIGDGLILLGVKAARRMGGIPAKASTTVVGTIVLVWGALDIVFNPRFEVSFAMRLIVAGVVSIASLLASPKI